MMELVERLRQFIQEKKLLEPTDRVLVAVSGGLDSMVMLWLLSKLNYPLAVAHANFQLRSKSSHLDQEFVRQAADTLQVPFHLKKFETRSFANERGISTQMAARDLRYQWFEEISKAHNYQKIAVGHHLNDVLETLLLNLTKGTGISGLHGILPVRGQVIRPLLFATKEQLLNYAESIDISWREDSSNAQDKYQRNLIRHKVVPILKQINPSVEEAAKNTAALVRSVEIQYERSIHELRRRLIQPEGQNYFIMKKDLQNVEAPILFDVLKQYGFTFDQCNSLLGAALAQSGKLFQSDSHILNVDRSKVFISLRPNYFEPIEIPTAAGSYSVGLQHWQLSEHSKQGYTIVKDHSVGAFDFEKLSFPLLIRKWLPGDRFCPLGMNHQKKISDFLIDQKVPLVIKENVMVLISEEALVWVVGYRIDDRYKITDNTTRVLEISIKDSLIK